MRTIEIDDEIYDYLRQNTQEIGESASSILRRLLNLNAAHQPGRSAAHDQILAEPARKITSVEPAPLPTRPALGPSSKLRQFLTRTELESQRSAVDRFLTIL